MCIHHMKQVGRYKIEDKRKHRLRTTISMSCECSGTRIEYVIKEVIYMQSQYTSLTLAEAQFFVFCWLPFCYTENICIPVLLWLKLFFDLAMLLPQLPFIQIVYCIYPPFFHTTMR